MNPPEARLPSHRQALVSEAVYKELAKTPWCARLGDECKTPCQPLEADGRYPVDLEHIIPLSKGGSNALNNCRWLCRLENDRKYNLPDPYYSGQLYFDQKISVKKLRPHQQIEAYGKAIKDYKDVFLNPDHIFKRFMLLAWLMGAGKTIGMLSILFGINHVRKMAHPGSRRIKKVLWLVHQRSLVQSIAKELRSELSSLGIAKQDPKVEEIGESWHWHKETDVYVACPHALWDSDQNRLTHDDRAAILSKFDAIVVDEAQFAVDRYIDICNLAPLAYKFAVTATPMDGDGRLFCEMHGGAYRDTFARYSVFDYSNGREQGIYKQVPSYEEGIDNGNYIAEAGGEAEIADGLDTVKEKNTGVGINLVRDLAIIQRAKTLAKVNSRNSNFDHHVMIRAGNVAHAKHWVKALQKEFAEDSEYICGAWSGQRGRSLGDDKHPWMLVKTNETNKGRMIKGSARFLFVVDMGQFGLNNRYCSTIAWLEPSKSLVELIQRIGRAIRRGPDQKQDPEIYLLWSSASRSMATRMEEAIEYIRDMGSRMHAFPSILDILSPDIQDLDPVAANVKPTDRVRIASIVGQHLDEGEGEEGALDHAIKQFKKENPKADPQYIEKVRKYGEELQDPEFRKRILDIDRVMGRIPYVTSEGSCHDYTKAQVISAIKNCEIFDGISDQSRSAMIEEISKEAEEKCLNHKIALELLKERDNADRETNRLISYPVNALLTGSKGRDAEALPMPTVAQLVTDKMMPAVAADKQSDFRSAVFPQVNKSAAKAFGHSMAEKVINGRQEALADCLSRELVRRQLTDRTFLDLLKVRPDLFPGLVKRFEDVIR